MTISIDLADPAPEAGRPKYLAIADAIEAAVMDGKAGPDEALPTHRELAERLGVTVGTVTRGYAEAARRGLVRGETGRGTFIMSRQAGRGGFATLSNQGSRQEAGADARPDERSDGNRGAAARPGRRIDLGLTASLHSMAPDLARTLASLAEEPDLREMLTRPEPRGLLRHRRAGAKWAALHGMDTEPDDILVCAGAQHAILVAFAALFSPGDRVAVESLAYPQVRPVAKRLRLELVPLAMDEFGVTAEALAAACAREPLRGLYVTPSCQNPTMARMPAHRRQEIAELCRVRGIRIVEDDVYRLMADTMLPPLSRLVPEQGCFIASTSKVLADGLRVAYLCAPPGMARLLEASVEATVWVTAPLMAEIATRWIMDGAAQRAVAANRIEAALRARIASDVLGEHRVRTKPTAGFAWLPLPRPWRSVEFAQAAAERGVVVAHMEHFAVGGAQPEQAVRLSLCGVPDHENLRAGLETLAELLRW